jgi:hypothetical protein
MIIRFTNRMEERMKIEIKRLETMRTDDSKLYQHDSSLNVKFNFDQQPQNENFLLPQKTVKSNKTNFKRKGTYQNKKRDLLDKMFTENYDDQIVIALKSNKEAEIVSLSFTFRSRRLLMKTKIQTKGKMS